VSNPFIDVHGICIQCALKEFVEQLERGLDPLEQPPTNAGHFEGDPLEHLRTVHPDPEATDRERRDLDARARVAFDKLKELKMQRARAARYN